MALWEDKDQHSGAPKFVVDSETGDSGQDRFGNTVFGVDLQEAVVSDTPGIGWIKRTVGTGEHAGRVREEVLVAMSKNAFKNAADEFEDATDFANTDATANTTGDADDAIYPDA